MVKFVKLGDVCLVRRGTSITRKDTLEGMIPVIGGGRKATYYHNKQNRNSGTITISGSGASAGLANYWSVPIFASDCSTVEPIDNKQNMKFVYYYLQSKQEFIYKNLISGAAQPHVYAKDIANLNFPLLSIEEQLSIVTKLDATFSEIDSLNKLNIKKENEITLLYENYKNKIFDNILDFEQKKLKEVCEKITDGTHQTPKYFDKGYVFLSSRNVKSKIINWEKIEYVDEKQHVEMQKRVSPKMGDILLAKNGTTGMAAIVDRDIPFDIYVSLALLRCTSDILPEYLLEFINSKAANKQFSERTKGIGVQNLHLQEIREVLIKYPKSKIEQKDVIKKNQFINTTYKELLFLREKIINNLKALKLSILTKELQI